MDDFARYCKNRIKYGFFKFLFFFLVATLIFFICDVKGVFAATYVPNQFYAELYDNLGPTLNRVDSYAEEINGEIDYYYGFLTLNANSSGGAWIISSPIPIINGNTYSMTIKTYASVGNCGTTTLSSYNRIGLGSTINWAKSSYQENTLANELYSKAVNNSYIQYVFKAETNASYIAIPFATTSSCSTGSVHLEEIAIDDLGAGGVSESTINSSLTNQTNEINTSINNSTNKITGAINETEDNINQNINDMESAIVDSNKETQDVIKDQFNSCHDSYNLLNITSSSTITNGVEFIVNDNKTILVNGTSTSQIVYNLTNTIDNIYGGKYLKGSPNGSNSKNYSLIAIYYDENWKWQAEEYETGNGLLIKSEYPKIRIALIVKNEITLSNVIFEPMITTEENKNTSYEPYGEEVCSNKLDEQNDTIKGGFSSIGNWFKELGDKIGNFFDSLLQGILDGLKQLFIPKDGYFENWFNDLKLFFEEKLGFLATPFTIIIDFVNRYLELDSGADIIINIPNIRVPNFEDHIIISATSLNWSQLLRSKESLNSLWQLYLSFVDVFLILNFINLCENKYNRIFGGDVANYEYYTVEDSYTYDNDTGEVKSARRNERTTTRKKVN